MVGGGAVKRYSCSAASASRARSSALRPASFPRAMAMTRTPHPTYSAGTATTRATIQTTHIGTNIAAKHSTLTLPAKLNACSAEAR